MSDQKPSTPEQNQSPKNPKRFGPKSFGAEEWILLAGVICVVIFLWMMLFLFLPLLTNRPLTASLPQGLVDAAATRGFVLPPTWTPGPTPVVNPTNLPTGVYDGTVPTRVYTPRPTSLPGLPITFARTSPVEIVDLARIMQGESPGDQEAAYYVGWVAKNRLIHGGYGNTFAGVSSGFFGYRVDIQPSEDFLNIARRVMQARQDPTDGSLYALSRTDITNLGVPAHRADVAVGEWFFFKTWPVNRY